MTTLAPPPRRPSTRTTAPRPRPAAPRRTPPPPRRLRLGDPSRRLRIWQVGLLVLLSIVAARVVDLQAVQGPTLAASALKDRTRTVVLPATRGDITDMNGVPLATTVAARNVTVDQTLVKDVQGEAQQLATVLGGDAEAYAQRMTGTRRFVYLAKNVTPDVWAKVADLKLPGVFSEPTTTRIYPAGEVAANVVGHVRADGNGGSGLEYGFDKELAGVAGTQVYQSSARGTEIPTVASSGTDPVAGTGVRLTIDRDLQWVAQEAIAQKVKEARADSGTVVVMDPRTGQIRALATVPTFDPNRPADAAQADVRQPRRLRRLRARLDEQDHDDGRGHRGGQGHAAHQDDHPAGAQAAREDVARPRPARHGSSSPSTACWRSRATSARSSPRRRSAATRSTRT